LKFYENLLIRHGCNTKLSSIGFGSGSRCSGRTLPGFLNDAELNALALGKSHPRLGSLANGEDIAQTSGKLMASGILDVDGLKGPLMLLPVLDDSNTTSVSSTSHHHHITNIKLDEVNNLVGLQVKLYGVISPNEWIRVPNSPSIICVEIRNAFLPKLNRPYLAKLELQMKIIVRVLGK